MEEKIDLISDDECIVCYETLCDQDILEPCRHHVHRHCFLKTESNLCPVCRQVVKKPKPKTYSHKMPPCNQIVPFMCVQVVLIVAASSLVYTAVLLVRLWSYF
jgi:Ring finger domain